MALTGKRPHFLLLSRHSTNSDVDENIVSSGALNSSTGLHSLGAGLLPQRKRPKFNTSRFRPTIDYSSPLDTDDDCNDTGYSSIDVDSMVHPERKNKINLAKAGTLAQLVKSSSAGNPAIAQSVSTSCKNDSSINDDTSNESSWRCPANKAENHPSDSNVFSSTTSASNYLTTAVPRPLSRHSSCVVPQSDLLARERCFDYIVQSIDEVWARYCDTTSSAEKQLYPYGYVSPVSDSEFSGSESDLGYKSSTDAETDYESRKVSNLPDSKELQSLKDRLTKAKHDLEQSVDSLDYNDCTLFWKRWDMIKYNAVEMMEEEDDDELVESVIEELEEGRWYSEP